MSARTAAAGETKVRPATNNGSSSSPSSPKTSSTPVKAALTTSKATTNDGEPVVPDVTGAVVDMDVFGQLLDIDDDDDHEFSKTLAFDYISQAETTFKEIQSALDSKDLDTLSKKGHFLKGSSAALGLQRVQHLCESMQHTGAKKDGSGDGPPLSEEVALKRCSALLDKLRTEQEAAKEWLHDFYKQK